MEISGKTAVVTGGARGLGKAYATALLERKAKVLITDILEVEGRETEKEFQEKYGKDAALFVVGDVTSQESMEAVFDKAVSHFGGLHITINNAGVSMAPEEINYAVNQFGVIRGTKLAQKIMSKNQGGQGGVIVNIGSITGLYTIGNRRNAYFASKHAVVGFTSCYGGDPAMIEQGVRVACMCPGFARTDMVKYFSDGYDAGDQKCIDDVDICGGWTPIENLTTTMMKIIETDVPGGSVVQVMASGTYLVDHGPTSVEKVRKPLVFQ